MGAIMGRIRCAQTPVIQTPVYNGVLRVVPPTYHSVSTAYSIAKIENEPKPTAIQKLSCIASNYVGQWGNESIIKGYVKRVKYVETSTTSVSQGPSTREQGSAENVTVEVISGRESDREIADFQGSKEIAIINSLRSLKPLVDDKRILRVVGSFASVHLRREQWQPTILLECSYINKLVTVLRSETQNDCDDLRFKIVVDGAPIFIIRYRAANFSWSGFFRQTERLDCRRSTAPRGDFLILEFAAADDFFR